MNLQRINMSTQYQNEVEENLSDQKTAPPPMYKVLLLNDDFTPMDFVVEVLQSFFYMDREKATRIMMQIHTQGQGMCGVYTKDIAESKVELVLDFARAHQHPLQCTMEKN